MSTQGIDCPHCGTWNLHKECGTYEVLFPMCKACGGCTEIPPEFPLIKPFNEGRVGAWTWYNYTHDTWYNKLYLDDSDPGDEHVPVAR